jgi:hypothetical protein
MGFSEWRATRHMKNPVQTRTVIAFRSRERRAAIATPGTHLNVRIDPSDPARVAVDATRMF